MNALRVLLVDDDPGEAGRIADFLERASHAVLPADGLQQAAQALEIQRFDAVVLSSRLMSDELLSFRGQLNRLEKAGKESAHIPVLCYAEAAADRPSAAVLSQYQVDACLPEQFDAHAFSEVIENLSRQLYSGLVGSADLETQQLPVFNAEGFQEQLGYDHALTIELLELFLADSQKQLEGMRTALGSGDLMALSRIAHSLKGSLGSLYAGQSAVRAHRLEQVAKGGDHNASALALTLLEADLQTLEPELLLLLQACRS